MEALKGGDNSGCILKAEPKGYVVSLHVDTERERLKIPLFAFGWNNYKSEVVENWFGEVWEMCALGKQQEL